MKTYCSPTHSEAKQLLEELAAMQDAVIVAGAGISTVPSLKVAHRPALVSAFTDILTHLQDLRFEGGHYRTSPNNTDNLKELLDFNSLKLATTSRDLYKWLWMVQKQARLAAPTATHYFIRNLHQLGLLSVYYTQNIDSIDDKLEIPRLDLSNEAPELSSHYVQLNGSVTWLKCSLCDWRGEASNDLMENLTSTEERLGCPKCLTEGFHRRTHPGYIRTDLLLYGDQKTHADEIESCFQQTIEEPPEVFLVLGTSLDTANSHDLVSFIGSLSDVMHQAGNGKMVYINRHPPPSFWENHFDYYLAGDLDDWCGALNFEVNRRHAVGLNHALFPVIVETKSLVIKPTLLSSSQYEVLQPKHSKRWGQTEAEIDIVDESDNRKLQNLVAGMGYYAASDGFLIWNDGRHAYASLSCVHEIPEQPSYSHISRALATNEKGTICETWPTLSN
ncbi:hypothetical protein FRC11_003170 [Ceratobasidium sp. 423]|nr:hypothetical protein FRC11_003170 [Ceratobasidium sp. 423]